ncbi:MAG: AAA family ATPase [Candidatus Tectomicrobia bacterium]|nr:AAA family ATPase [Candidatus Tectomicrobia bacterium]
MLTRLIVRQFKCFEEIDVELGQTVVFIGPNNCGKTTALQALALWEIGLKRWNEKRKGKAAPEKRPGVTINRRDLLAMPVPNANLLWRNLHVRDVNKTKGKQVTRNIRVDIMVEGVAAGQEWRCGLEFDYANEESLYCRPLRMSEEKNPPRMPVPEQASHVRVAFLPPMSGLAANEIRLDVGAINVRLGEGRTAEVLRNLCYMIASDAKAKDRWKKLSDRIHSLFGIQLRKPVYIDERGEIEMSYRTHEGIPLDLSTAGRGLHQTLLLLSHLEVNPGAVLLLDEPDAHLEILRQRQIYNVLTEVASECNSQLLVASHSEVLLNEAADRDIVVAFVGKPHRIDDRGSQVLKSFKSIGFDQYYQAELTGWVLYLEGSTGLELLRVFAKKLRHPAEKVLERVFFSYVLNQPHRAREHFYGLQEAKPDLVGFALFDRIGRELQQNRPLLEYMWKKYEIECYVCIRELLLRWAVNEGCNRYGGPLIGEIWKETMQKCIAKLEEALLSLKKPSPWSSDLKVSDEFLDILFENFFGELKLPNLMQKTHYHTLVNYMNEEEIDHEISDVLDSIAAVAERARPCT